MSARLPYLYRRRAAEQRRVDAFVAAIRATAPAVVAPLAPAGPSTVPLPRVELVVTASGPVWALDEATRARLVQP